MIRDLRQTRPPGAIAANLGSGSTDGGLSCIAVCSLHGCYGNSIRIVVFLVWRRFHVWTILRRWFGVVLLGMGRMVAVEYEGKAGLFYHRLIPRTASTAAMLNTAGKMCDSRNGLLWIFTPGGDVYPELLRVPGTNLS